MGEKGWLILAALAVTAVLGFRLCAGLLWAALWTLLGFLGLMGALGWRRAQELEEEFAELEPRPVPGLFHLLRRSPPYKPRCPTVQVHSQAIETLLDEIINLVLRDFVEPWYSILTTDETFKESLKSSANQLASVLSQCLAGVNWEKLLLHDLVDDFASHIRLYRKSRERLEKAEDPANADLESLFFDLELEMEKSYCRDLVSTSPKYENAYLHDLADTVLYLVAAGEDFRCRPLRFLLREILVRRIVVPMVDQLSDPDFINHFIVSLVECSSTDLFGSS